MRTTEGTTTEATTTTNNSGNSTQNELDLPETPHQNEIIKAGTNGKQSSESATNDSATGMKKQNETSSWKEDDEQQDADATEEINTAYNETKKPNSHTQDSQTKDR